MKLKFIFTGVLFIALMAACAPVLAGGVVPTDTPFPTATPIPATPAPTHLPVDLTPAQRAAVQALSDKYKIPVEQVKLVSTEAVTWPNGCLGVVIPGVMCTQNLVDGFKVTLEANGMKFEFHTNQDGTSVIDAAQLLATLRFAVSASDHTIQLVDPQIPLGPTYDPAFTGFLPTGGSSSGTAYVLDFTNQAKAVVVDGNGNRDLTFIQNPNYGLAFWPGGPGVAPRLAWGTQLSGSDQTSSLMVSNLDGSNLTTLLTQPAVPTAPTQLVAEAWSMDGQSLYFSKEPVGLGGYILFAGASNLYRIDVASKQVTELIPASSASGPAICLDAISGDFRFVADHCTPKTITIRDLSSGGTTTVQPPTDVTGFQLVGSARFSPDGSRLAFALAKGEPNNEQGWVAVSDGAGGSKLVLTGQAGSYDTVIGWLDDQTLLVQANTTVCDLTCNNQLWTVGMDGSKPTKVADGSFLAVLDNR